MNRDSSVRAAPTCIRYGVLGFACALAMVTYLDRASIGSAQGQLRDALGLQSIGDLTFALSAFNFAYAIFEVPTGWLGDVFGPRRTLIRIVLWWSFFTVLTGLAGLKIAGITFVNLVVLAVIRFLFGMGEAGAYPNITRALHNWFPLKERGFAQGWIWLCSRLMGGLTPLVWMVIVERCQLSWRLAFAGFGILGVLWCVAFALWFRNRPEEHPSANDAERALIRAGAPHDADQAHAGVPWGKVVRSRTLWALCLMYACTSYGWYFSLFYLPAYLEEQHGVLRDDTLGSLYKGGPLILGAAGCLLGGWGTDTLLRRSGSRVWSRRLFGIVGQGLCVPCYLYCLIAPNAWTFALSLSLAGFFNDLSMGSSWAACQDIGKQYAAIVAGCMNTIGNLGGAAATLFTGLILSYTFHAYATQQHLTKEDLAVLQKQHDDAKTFLKEAREQQRQLPETEREEMQAKVQRWEDLLRAGNLPGYHINFVIYALVYAMGALLWFGVNASRPVVPETAPPGAALPPDAGGHFRPPPDERTSEAADDNITP
jgi:MFS family permease